jgi:hypothetical protein
MVVAHQVEVEEAGRGVQQSPYKDRSVLQVAADLVKLWKLRAVVSCSEMVHRVCSQYTIYIEDNT